MRPDWCVHPGEILQEVLDEIKMSQSYLAFATGYSQKHINQIVKGHVAITATVAVRLERELGEPSAEFWMGLQTNYDLHVAREKEAS
jgi:addiction module HigA family antidote